MKFSTGKKNFVLLSVLLLLPFFSRLFAQDTPSEADYFTHLQQLYFENSQHRYDDYLLERLENFDLLFPESKQLDQIYFMLGEITKARREPYRSFYYFAKLIFTKPSSKLKKDAVTRIDSLLTSPGELQLAERSDSIFSEFNKIPAATSPEESAFNLLSFIYSLSCDSLQAPFMAGARHYRQRFGLQAAHNDILLLWQVRIFNAQGSPATAKALLRELIALYPKSDVLPAAWLDLAAIEQDYFKNYTAARDDLLQVIDNFPESEQSARAQFRLARLFERYLHQPQLALENYRLVADAFAASPYRCPALFQLGKLLAENKDYTASAQAYMQYYEHCADSGRAVLALQQIADMCEHKLHNQPQLAATLLLLAQHTPNDSAAAGYLFRAATIYSQMPDQKEKAREACRIILKQYPNTSVAQKAAELLKALKP